MTVVDENGKVDCDRSANWWRCDCGEANWNTLTCRKCGHNRIWHEWGSHE